MFVALVASILGASLVADALESESRLKDYYRKSAKGKMELGPGWRWMHGQDVDWAVEDGEAVWIDSEYVRPIEGNIFDAQKLGAVARGIQSSNRRVQFMAGYGIVQKVKAWNIQESIKYQDYEDGPPLTTGDEELDEYLMDPDQWLDDNEWQIVDPDDDENAPGDWFADREALKAHMEERLREAEENEEGDFGEWTASVRDGNHRTFGAILSGERRVAVRIYDNDVQDIRHGIRSGQLSDDDRALFEKMVNDSGTPWWLENDFKRRSPEARRVMPGRDPFAFLRGEGFDE